MCEKAQSARSCGCNACTVVDKSRRSATICKAGYQFCLSVQPYPDFTVARRSLYLQLAFRVKILCLYLRVLNDCIEYNIDSIYIIHLSEWD